MRLDLTNRKFPFYVGLTSLVLSIVLSMTGLFFWISYRESTAAAIATADRLFAEINEKVMERYRHALGSVSVLAGSAALMPGMATAPTHDGLSHPGLPLMLKALEHYEYLFSLYTGYDDGGFLQVIAPRGRADIQDRYGAPGNTAHIVRAITRDGSGQLRQHWRFLDRSGKVVGSRDELEPDLTPATRPWYKKALESDTAIYTEPYVFQSSRAPGITCARKLHFGPGVFGADITLERFALSLKRQRVSENGALFLFDRKGRLIAHPKEAPVKTVSAVDGRATESLDFAKAAESKDPLVRAIVGSYQERRQDLFRRAAIVDINGAPHLVHLSAMDAALKFDLILGNVAPLSDFTAFIKRMQIRTAIFAGLLLILALPLAFWLSRKISRSLVLLEKESEKIQQFDFSESAPFDSMIKEIHAHIQAFLIMKATIRARTDALIATQKKLEKLVQSGIALSAEDDMDKLLKLIFDAAKELSNADGGTLYTRDEADVLRFEIMRTASREILKPAAGGESGESIAGIPLYHPESGAENHDRVESHVVWTGATVVINDVATENRFRLAETCRMDAAAGTACDTFLTVPLKPREGKTIGVMQVYNARKAETGDITAFDSEIVGFVEALAAQAAVALHNKKLLDEQRKLFDAFIRLMAGAIDAKSPYTGGHCARVPEIAVMLARAAHGAAEGPFADFRLHTEDQWREFRVAAWLHDCGKVTTPEYVVDKATKLETIYNRIHEIRMRFEVLLRDAEIDYYQKRLLGQTDERLLEQQLREKRRAIMEDYAFVAECNVGGEFMGDDEIERLKAIGSRKWRRHLDDRIGISQEEAERKNRVPAGQLPVSEFLLADKPEHVIPRLKADPFEGNPFGFQMTVPAHLYDLGEVYNLSIRRGTLTEEERFKINEHMIQTILMLKRLPFPVYLENVAEVAGAHHETMIGTGYPRRLKKEDMSVSARIMAIADIFEALTASDRPYKKAKTLSESLRIMSFMRNDRHIDADLFDLFLTSGVYRTYAEKFLQPRQIDAVKIEEFLKR
ncbi:MAG: HD domain-containing phosphohydrolase [Thermodesulfobacteriota bacterium]